MAKYPRQMRLTPELVALLPPKIDDPGPMPMELQWSPDYTYEDTIADSHKRLMAGASPEDGLWLFACGSLIWKKRFDFEEERTGLVRGWHRSYCMGPDTRYRGNPGAPSYTLSMDRGGQCKGMVYRLKRADLEANLDRLLRAEPPFPPSWLTVETAGGRVRAFAFTAPRRYPSSYVGRLSDEQVADALARAVGMWGSSAEYLYSTCRHLEDLNLCDARLWRLQELVADRIKAAYLADKEL